MGYEGSGSGENLLLDSGCGAGFVLDSGVALPLALWEGCANLWTLHHRGLNCVVCGRLEIGRSDVGTVHTCLYRMRWEHAGAVVVLYGFSGSVWRCITQRTRVQS